MSKHGEYRANAETALQMAARSDDDEFKAIMLKVARAGSSWLSARKKVRSVYRPTIRGPIGKRINTAIKPLITKLPHIVWCGA